MIRTGPTRHSFQEFAISSVAARTDAHVLSYWRMGRKSAIAAPTSTTVCILVVTDVIVMIAPPHHTSHAPPVPPRRSRIAVPRLRRDQRPQDVKRGERRDAVRVRLLKGEEPAGR